ncbi:MAG: small nuclear ribonucleoprotein [Candidatus Diapherotrites archaeon CG08_land_8_20_14_0_20_34_12]|nr:MAG: small nuclear ribonucleoprotein [Candidatus Diapherotrites archaeon CG08_land_8_20_14_0_20_34_12]
MTVKPFDVLTKRIGQNVLLQLKGGKQVRGILKGFDVHLNIVLGEAEELEEGQVKSKNSEMLIRGDSIVFINV